MRTFPAGRLNRTIPRRLAAQGAAKTAASSTKAAKAAAEESKRAASFVARHWKGSLAVLVLGLLLLMVMIGLQSCTAMFGSAGGGIAASSYFSEDSDMLAAEDAYAQMEAELQAYLDNYEANWQMNLLLSRRPSM